MENLIQSLAGQPFINVTITANIEREIQKEVDVFTEKVLRLIMANTCEKVTSVPYSLPQVTKADKRIRILCVGNSVLTRNEIVSIFQEEFSRKLGLDLPKKSIETPVLDYRKMKSFDLLKKLKSNRYDYVIVGQRPHSTANKGIKTSLLAFKMSHNLKAVVTDWFQTPLNRAFITEMAKNCCKHWALAN